MDIVRVENTRLSNLLTYAPPVLTVMYVSYVALTTYLKDMLIYPCLNTYLLICISEVPTLLLAIAVILGASLSGLYIDYIWKSDKGTKFLATLLLLSSTLFVAYVIIAPYLSQKTILPAKIVFWFVVGILLGNMLTSTSLFIRYKYSIVKRGTLVGSGIGLGAVVHLVLASLGLNLMLITLAAFVLSVLSAATLLIYNRVTLRKPTKAINEGVSLYDVRILMFLIPLYVFFLIHGLIIRSHILPYARILIPNTLLNEVVLSLPMILSVLAGIVMDSLGRKVVGIAGLIVLGITSVSMLTIYALIISPIELSILALIFSRLSAALIIPYVMVISSELAPKKFTGKFLSICYGTASAGILTGVVAPIIFKTFYLPTAIAAMILFISVYILYVLPETLPPEYLRYREIVSYLKKAMKLTGKSRAS